MMFFHIPHTHTHTIWELIFSRSSSSFIHSLHIHSNSGAKRYEFHDYYYQHQPKADWIINKRHWAHLFHLNHFLFLKKVFSFGFPKCVYKRSTCTKWLKEINHTHIQLSNCLSIFSHSLERLLQFGILCFTSIIFSCYKYKMVSSLCFFYFNNFVLFNYSINTNPMLLWCPILLFYPRSNHIFVRISCVWAILLHQIKQHLHQNWVFPIMVVLCRSM